MVSKKVKVEQEEVVEKDVEVKAEEVVVTKVTKLEVDFGREDLNSLRNKVNELVDAVNSK